MSSAADQEFKEIKNKLQNFVASKKHKLWDDIPGFEDIISQRMTELRKNVSSTDLDGDVTMGLGGESKTASSSSSSSSSSQSGFFHRAELKVADSGQRTPRKSHKFTFEVDDSHKEKSTLDHDHDEPRLLLDSNTLMDTSDLNPVDLDTDLSWTTLSPLRQIDSSGFFPGSDPVESDTNIPFTL